jgi:lipid-A-disaccharide synthase
LSIIPFEKEFYKKKDKITYVGHPLLDEIKEFKQKQSQNNSIAFLAGSRKGEIEKLIPIFKKVASNINKKSILVIPPHFSKKYIQETYGDISQFIISNDTYSTLKEVDFAFICSGTATLEASIIGTPFVLAYIAKPFDYFIAKHLVKLKYIGLANIFFDKMGKKPIHKELIQDKVTIKNLLDEYQNIDKNNFLNNSKILRDYLKNGSSLNVANIIKTIFPIQLLKNPK